MKAAVADLQCLYYLDANCLLHQLHLIVREDLQLIDSFLKGLHEAHPDVAAGFHAYAANLAKCCNFWRSHVHGSASTALARSLLEPIQTPCGTDVFHLQSSLDGGEA